MSEKEENKNEIRYFDIRDIEEARKTSITLRQDEKDDKNKVESSFDIVAILPSDNMTISHIVASMRGGIPAASYEEGATFAMYRNATIDFAVKKGPPWWKNAARCASEEFLVRLYNKIIEHSNSFQENLKKNKLTD